MQHNILQNYRYFDDTESEKLLHVQSLFISLFSHCISVRPVALSHGKASYRIDRNLIRHIHFPVYLEVGFINQET